MTSTSAVRQHAQNFVNQAGQILDLVVRGQGDEHA